MKRKHLWIPTALISFALLASLAVSGCGSGSNSKSAVMETAAAPAEVYEEAAYTAADAGGGLSAGISVNGPEIAKTANPQERKLIRDMYLSLETTEFDLLSDHITEKVSELGGYIQSSETSGQSLHYSGASNRYAHIKARIPSDHLDQFIDQVEAESNVINKSETTTDITLQYADIESHKKSLETEQERLWALLEKAESLDAVIALESRLSEIRYQLESYETQLRLYDNQVDYSTVDLTISEVQVLTPSSPDSLGTRISKGFDRSISQLTGSAVSLFVWTVSNSPYLILLAALILVILKVFKIYKKRCGEEKEETKKK